MAHLVPDLQLLHYRLVAKLGRGGMGEVWRAVDTRLDREVAIKVLPDAVASDPERLARLEREARAIARLSHPNIITVHAVEEADGVRFVAMELVRGRELADLIPKDGLPIGRFLDLAIPVVDAVAAAHRGGVTHRDLKPSNVMVTDEGLVKILDFGLAKLTDEGPGDPDRTKLTTETIAPHGKVLGTAAYMSPEQAEGKAVDHRSDVFSLGVMFYEMLTGSRPFHGDTLLSLLSSIVKDTPRSVTEVRRSLPPGAGRIVRRTLAKEPERRYQTAIDLRNDLEDLRSEAGASRSAFRRFGVLAAVAVIVVAAGVGAWLVRPGRPRENPSAGVAAGVPGELGVVPITRNGNALAASISPDGKYVVYIVREGGQQGLRVRQMATGSDQEILALKETVLFGPKVSPEGEWIYYGDWQDKGSLYRLPMLGGHPQKLLDGVAGEFEVSPDGKRVAFQRRAEEKLHLMVAEIDGSDPRLVLEKPGDFQREIAWTGDGERIFFADDDPSGGFGAIIRQVSADGGAVTDLGGDLWQVFDLATMPGQNGLLVAGSRGGTAFQLPPQLWRLEPGRDAVRLTHDNQEYISPGFDRSGQTLVAIQRRSQRSYLILPEGNERHARRVAFTSLAGPYWCGIVWMTDGRLCYEDLDGDSLHIWITEPDGSGASKLTRAGKFNMGPAVSPDGRSIAYFSDRSGPFKIWLSDPDGGNARRLTNDDLTEVFPRFSPDGRWVFYHVFDDDGRMHVRKAPLAGGPSTRVTRDDDNFAPAVSHDGSKLAYASRLKDGDVVITVADSETGEVLSRIDHDFYSLPFLRWTLDDRGVAAVTRSGAVGNIVVHPLDGGPVRQITHFEEDVVMGFDWSPDGSSLALVTARSFSDVVLVTGLDPSSN